MSQLSGKPYPEGVARAVELLDKIATLNAEIAGLQAAVERLKAAKDEHALWAGELRKLLEDMDLTSEGNYGYIGRLSWFLAEMRRQTRSAS